MDNDLISRSALLEIVEPRLTSLRKEYGFYDQYTDGYEECADHIEIAPAVDAVEVVRCKDCKHWMYEYDDVGLCVADVPDIDGVERTAFNFCSIGEGRTE